MLTTTPDNIAYANVADPEALDTVTGAMATSIQNALLLRGIFHFVWANSTAQTAQTGMIAGSRGYRTDTYRTYFFDGTNWQIVIEMIDRETGALASTALTSTGVTSVGTAVNFASVPYATTIEVEFNGTVANSSGTDRGLTLGLSVAAGMTATIDNATQRSLNSTTIGTDMRAEVLVPAATSGAIQLTAQTTAASVLTIAGNTRFTRWNG